MLSSTQNPLTGFFFVLDNQIALELQGDGKLTTSDDPPVIFGCLDKEFIEKV